MSQKHITNFFKPLSSVREVFDNLCGPAKKFKKDDSVENVITTVKSNVIETVTDTVKSNGNGNVTDKVMCSKTCMTVSTQEQKTNNETTGNTLTHVQVTRCENNRLEATIKSLCRKYSVLHPSIDKSWFKALEKEFSKPYFTKLNEFIIAERSKSPIYPSEDKVWTWTSCPVDKVKVVVIGQDPYHHPRQAHGLCFSVPVNVTIPPSLVNIYKELENDIKGFKIPTHGNLIGWSRQGVLLLNSVLTVRQFNANSHKDKGWEDLTTAAIKYLSENTEGLVFLLWGAYAQNKAAFINKNKHHLLKSVHPSPLSAHRGFFGCCHFSRCNELLIQQNKTPIDWSSLPDM